MILFKRFFTYSLLQTRALDHDLELIERNIFEHIFSIFNLTSTVAHGPFISLIEELFLTTNLFVTHDLTENPQFTAHFGERKKLQ